MPFINRIIPFFIALIIFVFMVFGFVLLAYIILFSALLGIAVFIINWVRARLAPPPAVKRPDQQQGRIIDSDDWRKL